MRNNAVHTDQQTSWAEISAFEVLRSLRNKTVRFLISLHKVTLISSLTCHDWLDIKTFYLQRPLWQEKPVQRRQTIKENDSLLPKPGLNKLEEFLFHYVTGL